MFCQSIPWVYVLLFSPFRMLSSFHGFLSCKILSQFAAILSFWCLFLFCFVIERVWLMLLSVFKKVRFELSVLRWADYFWLIHSNGRDQYIFVVKCWMHPWELMIFSQIFLFFFRIICISTLKLHSHPILIYTSFEYFHWHQASLYISQIWRRLPAELS